MNTIAPMSPSRLEELIRRFAGARIAVAGDFFLDKYMEVDSALAEPSLETDKVAHQVVSIRHSPGAAGTVVCNLAALGCRNLQAVGIAGEDGESFDLRKDLARLGCSDAHLHVAPGRFTPTYLKPRDRADATLAGEHSRYDTKNRTPTPPDLQREVLDSLEALLPSVDAVIVLDQVEEADCGVITAAVAPAVSQLAAANPRVIFWADSRRFIRRFRNVIIKPNQFEIMGIVAPRPTDVVDLAALAAAIMQVRRENNAPVCCTCGAAGMIVSDPVPTLVPGVRVTGPVDPTGAGDSATAGGVL
ncbi:MAG: PfkB family carbohydrate kinase, partial [Tepidisphaeraceae bacterium]